MYLDISQICQNLNVQILTNLWHLLLDGGNNGLYWPWTLCLKMCHRKQKHLLAQPRFTFQARSQTNMPTVVLRNMVGVVLSAGRTALDGPTAPRFLSCPTDKASNWARACPGEEKNRPWGPWQDKTRYVTYPSLLAGIWMHRLPAKTPECMPICLQPASPLLIWLALLYWWSDHLGSRKLLIQTQTGRIDGLEINKRRQI